MNIDVKDATFIILALLFLVGQTVTLMDLQRRLRVQEAQLRELQLFVFERASKEHLPRPEEKQG